ncbi:MAG: protein-L-isoaspartate(D-aspartate) O-methyltransferase [Cytophaga sp.]|nr:protein-L-isoaspartate(D-aspartate) O-methyltransferase [Undibacterium sp.]
MTTKDRRFPLPLSSVVDKSARLTNGKSGSTQIAVPQTAMQNAIKNATERTKRTNSPLLHIVKPLGFGSDTLTLIDGARGSESIRRAMVERVAKKGVKDGLVLAALELVPRHLFIESGLSSQAYIDASIPIGHHQTISQPYIVGRMIEIMRNGCALANVLEIGTGCGYQAAVLSLVAKEVYSIERIKALHELAKKNLRPMRIANIRLHYGDGMLGLPQVAPFDGIILAAAGLEVPQALLDQLAIGGRLIAPVGGKNQMLQLIERVAKSEWKSSVLEHCHFVPLHHGVI